MDVNLSLAGLGAQGQTRPNAAGQAASGFADMLRQGELQSVAPVSGGADPHALVMALAESKLAVETVVTMRDRVVEAYQEILRMPV